VLPRVASADSAPPSASESGRERYEHVKPLGAGGMGEVMLVQDNDIGRRVAVKRSVPASNTQDGVGRFVEEIRTIGRLEHPNIIPIHDVGVDAEGRYFFV